MNITFVLDHTTLTAAVKQDTDDIDTLINRAAAIILDDTQIDVLSIAQEIVIQGSDGQILE